MGDELNRIVENCAEIRHLCLRMMERNRRRIEEAQARLAQLDEVRTQTTLMVHSTMDAARQRQS